MVLAINPKDFFIELNQQRVTGSKKQTDFSYPLKLNQLKNSHPFKLPKYNTSAYENSFFFQTCQPFQAPMSVLKILSLFDHVYL